MGIRLTLLPYMTTKLDKLSKATVLPWMGFGHKLWTVDSAGLRFMTEWKHIRQAPPPPGISSQEHFQTKACRAIVSLGGKGKEQSSGLLRNLEFAGQDTRGEGAMQRNMSPNWHGVHLSVEPNTKQIMHWARLHET